VTQGKLEALLHPASRFYINPGVVDDRSTADLHATLKGPIDKTLSAGTIMQRLFDGCKRSEASGEASETGL
jgi:hypothetical protein